MGKKSTAEAQLNALLGKSKAKKKEKGKKNRKLGRYGRHASSQRYKAERRWLSNKVKRIERHLRKYPNDKQAQAALGTANQAA